MSDGSDSSGPDRGTVFTRRNLLLGTGSLVGTGVLGRTSLVNGPLLQADPDPPGGGGGNPDTDIPAARQNIWTAQHRHQVSDTPFERRRRRYLISSNSIVQFVGVRYSPYGNPLTQSEQDDPGAWQYTFRLDSSAVALAPKELVDSFRGKNLDDPDVTNDELRSWPNERGTDWVPTTFVGPDINPDKFPGIVEEDGNFAYNNLNLSETIGSIKVGDEFLIRSVGENSGNIAVSGRRDADLFGVISTAGGKKFYAANQLLANSNSLLNPNRVSTANLASIKARIRERQADLAASQALGKTILTYIGGKYASTVTDKLTSALGLIDTGKNLLELVDDPDLDRLEQFEGFKLSRIEYNRNRPGNTAIGPVAGHKLVFDVYCPAGKSGAIKIESNHPVEGAGTIGIGNPDNIGTTWLLEFDAPPVGNPEDPEVRPSPPTLVKSVPGDDVVDGEINTILTPDTVGGESGPNPGINIPEGPYTAGDTIPVDAYDTARYAARIEQYEWTVERATETGGVEPEGATLTGSDLYYEEVDSGFGVEFPVTLDRAGKYRFTVTVTDAIGETGTSRGYVSVSEAPKPQPDIDGPAFANPGEDVTLTASNASQNIEVEEWTWVLPPGPFSEEFQLQSAPKDDGNVRSGKEVTERFPHTSAGQQYEIKLIAEAKNQKRVSTTYQLPIIPEPFLNVYPQSKGRDADSITIEPGDTVTPFWEYAPTFELATHAWSSGGEVMGVQQGFEPPPELDTDVVEPVSVRFDDPGEYEIRLTVRDTTGASATNKIAVTVVGGTTEYELTVEDSDDNEVGATTITDSTAVGDYGERVKFGSIGDRRSDGDTGYADFLRRGSGDIVESWETRTLDDYTKTNDGNGDLSIVSAPTSDGERALRMIPGSGGTEYTSDQDLLPIEQGITVQGDIRHETDNSPTFAMRSFFGVGLDSSGKNGIIAFLNNPGSQRTAGAELRTPNSSGRVEFEPELGEYYTLSIDIGSANAGFNDDFEYPTAELADNGWTIANGTFETSDSYLLGDAGTDPNRVRIYRDQSTAAGTFEINGIQNEAMFYGLRIDFISDAETIEDNAAGYRIQFKQTELGDVVFKRIDNDGTSNEYIIDDDHGGSIHDVRIERDPETYTFTVFYDGEERLTVEDETYTESTYWTMAYGGDLDSQRIDAVSVAEDG